MAEYISTLPLQVDSMVGGETPYRQVVDDRLNEGIPPELTAAPPDAILIVVDSQGNVVNVSRKGSEPLGRYEVESIGRAVHRAFVLRDGSEGAPAVDGSALETPVRKLARHGQAGERELLASRIIDLLNRPEDLAVTIHGILEAIKLFSGAEAAGIRLCQGDDYPYYESAGFAPTHLRTESSLCVRDAGGMPEHSGGGMPLLECMCGNVIEGRTDQAMPCFTRYGSFWTSDASGLLESLSEKKRWMFSRGVCIAEGYQSLALIPLRAGRRIVGLLQLNDRRKGRFGLELVEFLEGMGESVGVAVARKVALEKLEGSERDMALYNRMAGIFLTIPEKDTYTELLAVILKAMDSRLGVFGVIDEDGALALRSMTGQLFERPISGGVLQVFPRDNWGDNPWSQALLKKSVVWSNEPSSLLPRAHAAVRRHISQPIVHGGEVIGLLSVADREAAYTEADVRTMRAIADHLAPVLHARLERDRRMKERDRADAGLRESEMRYRGLVDNLSGVVVETDTDGKILFVSSRVEDVFGFRPEELVGKKFMEFAHPDDVERARAAVSGLSKEKPSFEFEFMRRHRDGHFIHVSTHGRLVETGGAPRVVAIVEDISSRKRADEELAKHREHLEELVSERTRKLNEANDVLKREMSERLRAEDERDRMFNLSLEKERQLSSIYSNVKDVLYLLSVEGEGKYRFFSVNRSFFAATGLTEDRVVGRDIREVIPEPSLTVVLGKYDEAIRSGETVRWEEVTEYPTGKKYGDVVVTPIFDSAGRCTSLVGSVHDMTERLRDEEERSRLASIVKDSDDAIYSKDMEGRITSWNPGAERIFGYAAGEATGRHVSFLIPPGHPDDAADMLMRVFRGEHVVHYETERMTKDGKVIDISLTISPIMGSSGHIIGASTIARDITEKKQTEESMRRLNEELRLRAAQLEAANRELESFSYSVSHDLRAPLRAMDGFSQALQEDYGGRLDDAGRDYLAKVRAAASRMAQLIDDLIMLSRVSRTDMRIVEVDLSAVAGSVAEELERSEPGRKVSWTIGRGLKARGDPALLRLALENLMGNAWKFTGNTNGAAIEFGLQEREGGKVFFVSDNGAGFDMKHSGKLFGAFQRLHSNTEFPGTGIGLATVQRIIHRHGGRVWAQGERGKGATFYFTLDQGRL